MMNITGVSEHIKLQRANMLTRPDASCLQAVKQLNNQTNSEQQQRMLPAAAAQTKTLVDKYASIKSYTEIIDHMAG